MFANQLQYHLIEVWSMVAAIALSDVNNAFRYVLLVAVVDTVNMKAGRIYEPHFAG